jgi:hypothetical protein
LSRSRLAAGRLENVDLELQRLGYGIVNKPQAGKKAPSIIGVTGKDKVEDTDAARAAAQAARDEMSQLRSDFQAELAKVKEAYQVFYDYIKDQQSKGIISGSEAAKIIADNLRKEGEAVLKVVDDFKKKVDEVDNVRQARKDKIKTDFDTVGLKSKTGTDKQASAEDRTALVDTHKQQQALYQIEEQESIRHARYMLEIIKQEAQAGFVFKSSGC